MLGPYLDLLEVCWAYFEPCCANIEPEFGSYLAYLGPLQVQESLLRKGDRDLGLLQDVTLLVGLMRPMLRHVGRC